MSKKLMDEQKNSIPSAKLISHVLIDFSSEAEMELFINYVEKTGSNFYENMKKIGLMRFRLNQVWNKEGGFALSTLFEYEDENAYVKGQKVIEKHFKENENFFKKITVKRLTTRTLNLLDYNY
jgi:hypothetical protein|tara:strand:- start:591 stop:959 length:369 start_codon:yes stop_codon:yes gene_type:complete